MKCSTSIMNSKIFCLLIRARIFKSLRSSETDSSSLCSLAGKKTLGSSGPGGNQTSTKNTCPGIDSSLADRYDNPIDVPAPQAVGNDFWNRFLGSFNVYKFGLRWKGCPLVSKLIKRIWETYLLQTVTSVSGFFGLFVVCVVHLGSLLSGVFYLFFYIHYS